ncbi:sodium-dependent proline transporter-like [Physella acuta]|uniref:sodium-dependent proline transporter-like n=1 Tax=Physella acuta TaxID=109671 RepID=UPI0027DE585C|nr:sodium-dependent proline transporter-like [Physella acuta]
MSLVLPSLPHNLPSGTSVASSLTVSRASHAREQWTGRLDYLLSCLGFAVGLGNVWRFPYMAFSNGGGAFFIPYFTMLIFTAMPVFVLESMVGQFSSLGATTCWEFCPFFRGCGVSMMFISGMTCIYYNMILAWAVYYIYASVAVEVPWFHCGNWSTAYCIENIKTVSIAECRYHNGTPASNGVCEQNVFDQVVLWDSRLAKISGVPIAFPAAEYFEREVLGCGRGYSMANMGSIKPHLLVSLILAWVLVFLCLYRGITISGKIVYVTALLPYGFLMVLFFRGVTLDGALEGIKYYIIPELDKTLSTTIWKNAGSQIFFSLSCAFGGLVTLSSYNKFHHDLLRDSLVVCLGNSLTSIFAGFVIFSFIGFLSKSTNIPISEVAAAGPTLAFIIYPFCLTKLPWTSLFSVFFFIMIILLGIDSQFVLVETVITGVLD